MCVYKDKPRLHVSSDIIGEQNEFVSYNYASYVFLSLFYAKHNKLSHFRSVVQCVFISM